MGTGLLRAKHRNPAGKQLLRFEEPAVLAWDQAAAALAIKFADEPVRVAIHRLVDGLQVAMKDYAVVDQLTRDGIGRLNPTAVKTYREVLREAGIFPAPRARAKMVAELRDTQASGDSAQVTKVQSKQPRVWSKHDIADGEFAGEPGCRVDVQHFFTLEEASVAMACVSPTMQKRFGMRTVRDLLHEAIQKRVMLDPLVVEQARQDAAKLIEAAAEQAYQSIANPGEGDVETLRDRILSHWPAPPASVVNYKLELRALRIFE